MKSKKRNPAAPGKGKAGAQKSGMSPPQPGQPQTAPPQPGLLQRIYSRLPIFFFLDRPTSAILYGCMLLYIVFLSVAFFAAPQITINSEIVEQPLYKNAVLQLKPGEAYGYLVFGPEGARPFSYVVSSSPSCSGVQVEEKESGDKICLSSDGKEAGQPSSGNLGYENHSVLLMAPWMLAASGNFTWSVNSVLSAGSASMSIPLSFRSEGKVQLAGRSAYVVSVVAPDSSPTNTRFFIDEQKRVLLKFESGNYSARLVVAPFALNWTENEK